MVAMITAAPVRSNEVAPAHWSAVYGLTLGASVLVASEFMPVSLLTPIATDLHLTEGQVGQAIAVSGLFAVLTSLTIAAATARVDRRRLLLVLTLLMLLSGALVALAPSYGVFLLGRAVVGVVIGGFWSMSAAIAMRLVPSNDVPRALAVFNGGNALATTVAAPLGSFLGQFVGWRGAFFCVVPLAAVTFAWLLKRLPSMPGVRSAGVAAPFLVFRRPHVPLGIVSVALFFMGQFGLFTYLRPFLETETGVSGGALSLILLVIGLAGLLGTYLIGRAVAVWLLSLLVALPICMAAIALGLVAFGASAVTTTMLLALWGFFGTAAPVAWWTWLADTVPDDAEAGGGLMVAVIQIAITLGAGGGGLVFDTFGYVPTFALSSAIFALSAIFAWVAAQSLRRGRANLIPSVQERINV